MSNCSLIVIYWRDIPAQVMAKQGRRRARLKLSDRFQAGINRAAMRAKKTDTDAYLDDWRREVSTAQTAQGEMEEIVQEKASQLEVEYDDARLERIIKHKGVAPTKVPNEGVT